MSAEPTAPGGVDGHGAGAGSGRDGAGRGGDRSARTSRIAPAVRSAAAAEVLAKATSHDGEPLVLMQVLARNPRLLRAIVSTGAALWGSERVPARERELVILRVAWRSGCEYEYGHHRLLAPGCGVSDDDVRATSVADLDRWAPADRALLAAADELCATSGLSDPTWADLTEHWSDDAVVDLLALVGTYRSLALVAGGLAVAREPGVPGWFDGEAER